MRQAFDSSDQSVRTDLALEATEVLRGRGRREIPGVEVHEEKQDDITVTRVNVTTDAGAELMGKPKGRYITIEAPSLRKRNRDLQQRVGEVLSREFGALLQDGQFAGGQIPDSFLVVGLGNWRATADSLGPKVVSQLLVTRHLRDYVPVELTGKLRAVAAVAPGVLGITGIETSEVVRGIVERTSPQAVVAIDSLCARSVDRIITTIQIADTGIHPGSGIGNKRVGLTRDVLGVPVIALGIPTVVHAMTIADNTLEAVAAYLSSSPGLLGRLDGMSVEDRRRVVEKAVSERLGDLVVTPKEIDSYIGDMARVVAGSLNVAFHPGIDVGDLSKYLF